MLNTYEKEVDIDDVDLEKVLIHQTLQLKINSLLNQHYSRVNLLNQDCLKFQTEHNYLEIYFCLSRLQGYLKPFDIESAKKAVVLYSNSEKEHKIPFKVLACGRDTFVLFTQSLTTKELIKREQVSINLESNEEIIHLSQFVKISSCFLSVALTNLGRSHFCYVEKDSLKIEGFDVVSINAMALARSVANSILKPFKTPPRIYQYCSTSFFNIDQGQSSLYLLVFEELRVKMIFVNLLAGYLRSNSNIFRNADFHGKSQRYVQKWQLDIQSCIGLKGKITRVWHINAIAKQHDRIQIIAGMNLVNDKGDTQIVLVLIMLDFFSGKLLNLDQNNLIFYADLRAAQAIYFNEFFYLLIRNASSSKNSSGSCSLLLKYGISEDKLTKIREMALPKCCSLSVSDDSLLLLTERETFLIEEKMIRRNMMDEQEESQMHKAALAQKMLSDNRQLLRKELNKDIERELSQKHYGRNLIQLMQEKRNRLANYLDKCRNRENLLNQLVNLQELEIQILNISIVLTLLEDEAFDKIAEFQDKQYDQVFLSSREGEIQIMLQKLIEQYMINKYHSYRYLLNIFQRVLLPENKNPLIRAHIRQKYFQEMSSLFQNIHYSELPNKHQIEDQLLEYIVVFGDLSVDQIRDYSNRFEKNEILKKLMHRYRSRNICILLYCETDLIENDNLETFVKSIRGEISEPEMHDFIKALVNLAIEDVKTQTFPKKDLLIFEALQPYHRMLYEHLQWTHPRIAWLLGLRMKIRNPQQIGNSAVRMKKTQNVQVVLRTIQDLNTERFKGDEIMCEILAEMGIKQFMTAEAFLNAVDQNDPTIAARKLSNRLWEQLKEYSLGRVPEENLKRLQKKLALY